MVAGILASALSAQKPAIDLITSNQQYKHPEAIMDTAYAVNPPVADSLMVQDRSARDHDLKENIKKNRRWQIGPSLDSLFQNRDSGKKSKKEVPARIASKRMKYNPLYIILTIIALK
jgi:hypothetical protein